MPLIARLALAALFIVAGILKLGHADDLASVVSAFSLGLPGPVVAFIAVALPPFEILLGIYLAGGWFLPESSLTAAALIFAFVVAIASVVARGITTPCGCFGSADTAPATWATVLRDVIFIVPAAYLVWWSRASARAKAGER
ncbi:MAG TPA: MauE/DoxX family redox-associated membrane protein [Candidatus Eremiobacteraceae bacterium]|nr:MauE/DoxX family redox-associated membrane protein [Candidatus Eremiobacteraceae bacterium]